MTAPSLAPRSSRDVRQPAPNKDLRIAGMGAVASIGDNAGAVYDALCRSRSGLGALRGFDASRYRTRRAYEVDDRPASGDVPGRATRWLLRAIEEALADAGLDDDLAEIPVLVGTGLRELRSLELWWRHGAGFDAAAMHFGTALRERFGACDTHTFSNACSASLYALGLAGDLLAAERASTVVVAGVDTLTESMFGLLDRVHADPPDAVRPFDRNRKGVLLGEGAAAVVLRAGSPADASGADGAQSARRSTVRLRSVGMLCDAYHVTAPDVEGITATMRDAYARAGVEPRDIDLILLHGTGTLLNDEAEISAVRTAVIDAGGSPLLSAIKSMTGHTSGGSGLLGVVVGATSLATGTVPPTLGLVDPLDGAAGLRIVRDVPVTSELRCVQVNAFGFGGLNAVAILDRPDEAVM